MARTRGLLYADTSALVKLVVREAESDALADELQRWADVAASALIRVELPLAVARVDSQRVDHSEYVEAILSLTVEVPVSNEILDAAAQLDAGALRTLDAIHVASALSLGDDISVVLSYDRRMQEAAQRLGLQVLAPS